MVDERKGEGRKWKMPVGRCPLSFGESFIQMFLCKQPRRIKLLLLYSKDISMSRFLIFFRCHSFSPSNDLSFVNIYRAIFF